MFSTKKAIETLFNISACKQVSCVLSSILSLKRKSRNREEDSMDRNANEREEVLRKIYAALESATLRELRKILILIRGKD